MSARPSHLDRRSTGLAAVLTVVGTLTGCQAIVSSAPEAHVRIINATPDAPRLDLYQDSNALAFNLDFGAVTSYIQLAPGAYNITTNTAGTRQILSSSKTNFAASGQYTVLIGNTTASLQQVTLADQTQPAPSGQVALRFINQATRTGPVDIYLVPAGQRLASVAPLVTSMRFGANTGYLNTTSGTYSLIMLPAGIVPTGSANSDYAGPQAIYSAGSVRTIILIDHPLVAIPGLQVITANDVEATPVSN